MPTTLRRIRAVEPRRDFHLKVEYDDGQVVVADFGPIIRQGGVLAPLADWEVFKQAKPDSRGRAICFPGDVDFCADALWLQMHASDVA